MLGVKCDKQQGERTTLSALVKEMDRRRKQQPFTFTRARVPRVAGVRHRNLGSHKSLPYTWIITLGGQQPPTAPVITPSREEPHRETAEERLSMPRLTAFSHQRHLVETRFQCQHHRLCR